MRVLHINSEKSWRGGEQQMANLITCLQRKGVENHVCAREGSESSNWSIATKLPVLNISFRGLKISGALALKKYVNANQIDLLHAHSSNAHTVAYIAALLGNKTPVIASKRTDFPIASARKYNHKNIKKIICVSDKIKEITQQKVEPREKVITIHSGVSADRFNSKRINLKEELQLDDKPLIGNCSALAPHKDYFTFLKVAKKAPYANFVIMGNGPLEDELKQFTKDHEINNVTFTGFLDDLHHKLHSLDLLLFTSATEGLGTSLLDAMLCEVPIVATNVGGIPEIVKNNQTGLLCEKGDVDSLEKSCLQILNDQELRKKITANAKELASNDFSDEQTANKTYVVYNDTLSQLTS